MKRSHVLGTVHIGVDNVDVAVIVRKNPHMYTRLSLRRAGHGRSCENQVSLPNNPTA